MMVAKRDNNVKGRCVERLWLVANCSTLLFATFATLCRKIRVKG